MNKTTIKILVGGLAACLPLLAGGAESGGNDHGLHVEFFAEPVLAEEALQPGSELRAGFRISDRTSGRGIPDLHPAGWMLRRDPGAEAPDAAACERLVRSQAQGNLSRPVDGDLNSFQILTLNADHSIGFINPLVNLNSANLQAIVALESPVAQWQLDERAGRAYLTLPERDELAVVDLEARRLATRIPVGEGPEALGRQPDGRYLWVANQSGGRLSVVDSARLETVAELPLAAGPVALAFDPRSRYAFAAGGGKLQRFDAQALQPLDELALDTGEWLLDYSGLADALYLVHQASGRLLMVRPERLDAAVELALGAAASAARLTPDGRYLLVLHPQQDRLSVVDTASNRLIRDLPTGHRPDQIAFSGAFAYVRNRGSADVTLIQLAGLGGEQSLPVAKIATGLEAPGAGRAGADFGAVAALPEGGGAMIANPADRTLYYYMEGMLAPSNTLKTYTAAPLALWIYDRSLQEVAESGRYATTLSLDRPGVYDVPFYLPSPQMILCFEFELGTGESGPQLLAAERPPRMQGLFEDQTFNAGEPVQIRFRLIDPGTGAPITGMHDGVLLSFKRRSHWQQRVAVASLGDGRYQAEIRYPSAGEYYLLLKSASLGLGFGEVEHLKLLVEAPAETHPVVASNAKEQ